MAGPDPLPTWLAWIPGAAAAAAVLIPMLRKFGSWLASRASQADVTAAIETARSERVVMVNALERRWDEAFRRLREQRQAMHDENKALLRELSGRLGEVEQGVARLEGYRSGSRR